MAEFGNFESNEMTGKPGITVVGIDLNDTNEVPAKEVTAKVVHQPDEQTKDAPKTVEFQLDFSNSMSQDYGLPASRAEIPGANEKESLTAKKMVILTDGWETPIQADPALRMSERLHAQLGHSNVKDAIDLAKTMQNELVEKLMSMQDKKRQDAGKDEGACIGILKFDEISAAGSRNGKATDFITQKGIEKEIKENGHNPEMKEKLELLQKHFGEYDSAYASMTTHERKEYPGLTRDTLIHNLTKAPESLSPYGGAYGYGGYGRGMGMCQPYGGGFYQNLGQPYGGLFQQHRSMIVPQGDMNPYGQSSGLPAPHRLSPEELEHIRKLARDIAKKYIKDDSTEK